MNRGSVLALEYLNVVNSNIQRPECFKEVPPPVTTTTWATTLVSSTLSTTSTSTASPTDTPDHEVPGSTFNGDSPSNRVLWTILGVSIVAVTVLVLVFVFVIRPRYSSKVLHVTKPIDEDDDSERTVPNVQTIPRLHVLHDPINGPYISGVNYVKHLEDDEVGWNGRRQQ